MYDKANAPVEAVEMMSVNLRSVKVHIGGSVFVTTKTPELLQISKVRISVGYLVCGWPH